MFCDLNIFNDNLLIPDVVKNVPTVQFPCFARNSGHINRFVKVLSYCNAMNVEGENFTASSVKLGPAPPFTLGNQMNLKCLYWHSAIKRS